MSDHDPYAPAEHKPDTIEARRDQPAPVEQENEQTPVETAPTGPQVPDGSVREVVEWIGDDKDRAKAAKEAEGENGRKGVLNYVKEVLGG